MTKRINDPPLNEAFENKAGQRTEHAPALLLDTDHYQAYLDSPDYTEAEKLEMVRAVWNIVVTCVDFGIGVEPLDAPEENCGKLHAVTDGGSQVGREQLNSQHTKQTGGA